MLLAALATSRFVHYAACTLLFGLSLYRLYAPPPARARIWLTCAGWAALVSGVAWLLLVTANLAGTLDLPALKTVITELSFGRVWTARLILAVLALALIGRPRVSLAASAVLLAAIALTGHTQIHEGGPRLLHMTADAIHLLGAGAWLGGLMGLTLMLREPLTAGLAATVARFSRMGYVAVAAILASGLVNAWMLVGSAANLTGAPYGRLLLVKVSLFSAMLPLALVNRFSVSPRLAPDPAGQAVRLRRHVLAEQALGVAVLACVAFIGLQEPPA